MATIRILVVDDSVVIRKLLSDTLSGDRALEVVGAASDGHIALAKIPLLKTDLITLDVEMPVMNGLETLAALRKLYPKLPVIMFSTLTEHGAAATLDALALGASDYATKPSNTGSPAVAIERIRIELIPKIKALCGVATLGVAPLPGTRPAVKVRARSNPRIEIVAIGTSTGGPNALAEVLPRIAPGDFHMKVINAGLNWRLNLNQGRPENSCRPAVDVLFRSVALAYGANVLGVVMTGMGSDGVLGAQHIRDAGGDVIIQDEASSVVVGMPGLVHASGLADAAYPLDRLAAGITRRVVQSRSPRTPVDWKSHPALEPPAK